MLAEPGGSLDAELRCPGKSVKYQNVKPDIGIAEEIS